MSQRDTVVFDLDGTLSDCSVRRHLVEGKDRDYEAFHARLQEDPLNECCWLMMRAFSESGSEVVLVSARPTSTKKATRKWLSDNGVVNYDKLFLLRPEGDFTPAAELKRAWLLNYGKERVLLAVDDCPKVARMFREEGVPCLLCEGRGD